MENEVTNTSIKRIFAITLSVCVVVGFLAAFWVAQAENGYVGSLVFGFIFLVLGLPLIIILAIAAIVVFSIGRQKAYGYALLTSCLLLPVSFIGALKLMEATGIAKYVYADNEMSPIGSELKQRIVIVFKKETSQEEIHRFDENVLRKKVPQPNGVLLAFADGICNFSYPQMSPEVTIVDVPFCADATEDQKQKIRDEVMSSPIIDTAIEDVSPGEVRKLK
jgi:hypothetical protein